EKGVAASRQLDKPEALVRVVPLHDGRHGRSSRSRLEAGAARAWCIAEVRRRQVVVVVEAPPLWPPKISISSHVRLGGGDKATLIAGPHSSQSMMIVHKSVFRENPRPPRPGSLIRLRMR